MTAKGLKKGTRRIGNQRKKRDHSNYCIVKNSQRTEKSPGNLRKLAVSQNPVKKLARSSKQPKKKKKNWKKNSSMDVLSN